MGGCDSAFATSCKVLVRLRSDAPDWRAAIRDAADMLLQAGATRGGLDASMEGREALSPTYLGSGVAIPHALGADKDLAIGDAVAVLQIRHGVQWSGGETVRLVIAISARSDGHIGILQRLTRLVADPLAVRRLIETNREGDIVAALEPNLPNEPKHEAEQDFEHALEWIVPFHSGLHVRPATQLVAFAKAAAAPVRLRSGALVADAQSLVQLLQLGLRQGSKVIISSEGPAAAAVLAAFVDASDAIARHEEAGSSSPTPTPSAAEPQWQSPDRTPFIAGVRASPGYAIGRLQRFDRVHDVVPDEPEDPTASSHRLSAVIARARNELQQLARTMAPRFGEAEARIISGQAELLDDIEILGRTCALIAKGHGVAWSWHEAISATSSELERLDNPVLAGRAVDLRDIGRRVLAHLRGLTDDANVYGGGGSQRVILVANDLSPSELASLDVDQIAGICNATGGPTAHSAILARALGIPMLVACGPELLDTSPDNVAILAADDGRLFPAPTQIDLASATAFLAASSAKRERERGDRHRPARTLDGSTIDIAANVNRPAEVAHAQEQGAEGVGLMRTEFLLLGRKSGPDEEEQVATYRAMIEAVGGNPLIIRTFDIGGDKPVPYLNLPRETNPFLGVRGARLLLRRPDLLNIQLRAIYRAASGDARVSIMFPMVTNVIEMVAIRSRCEACRVAVGGRPLPIGAMIEVPAAAISSASLAEHADFFSIGSNDLTQYTLAIDRQNTTLAAEADALHPAVLDLVHRTVLGAAKHGRWVGVCGGLAGDPDGAALLVGLGVTELSMTPADIPAVKQRLRMSSLADLSRLASKALEASSASEVRAMLRAGR